MESLLGWIRTRALPVYAGAILLAVAGSVVFLLLAGGRVDTILSTIGSSIPSGAGTGGGSGAGGGGGPSSGDGDGGSPVMALIDAARPDLLIIKTGALELQVVAVDPTVASANGIVTELGGYVSGSEQQGEGDRVAASVTYRIPADAWDAALEGLRALAIKVVVERTQTDDVSAEVVDLSARILNLEATEEALQAIMVKATAIQDVLDVQAELTIVRGQIEQATAERSHLMQQASFSTLTVRFSLRPEPAVIVSQQKFDPASEVDRASAALVDILQGLVTAGIWFGIVWLPILLALGIGSLMTVWIARRLSRSAVSRPEAPPA